MRELEFVPEWYAATYRRKRLLRLQVCVTIVLVLALATWSYVKLQQCEAASRLVDLRQSQLVISEDRVRERQVQQQLREQLQTQERVDLSLGLNVEASRVIGLVDRAMPKMSSLLELTIDTEEKNRPLERVAASRNKPNAPKVDRRLVVTLRGVTPTNGDIATLLENLSATGFCESLTLSYAKDRVENDHVMREFAVQFSINLNVEGELL